MLSQDCHNDVPVGLRRAAHAREGVAPGERILRAGSREAEVGLVDRVPEPDRRLPNRLRAGRALARQIVRATA